MSADTSIANVSKTNEYLFCKGSILLTNNTTIDSSKSLHNNYIYINEDYFNIQGDTDLLVKRLSSDGLHLNDTRIAITIETRSDIVLGYITAFRYAYHFADKKMTNVTIYQSINKDQDSNNLTYFTEYIANIQGVNINNDTVMTLDPGEFKMRIIAY